MSREVYLVLVVIAVGLDMAVSWIAAKRTTNLTIEAIADAFSKGKMYVRNEDIDLNTYRQEVLDAVSEQVLVRDGFGWAKDIFRPRNHNEIKAAINAIPLHPLPNRATTPVD